jgi:uracil-DNA glycosylase family 4
MKELDILYSDIEAVGNPKCIGCSILSQRKPEHSIMDYEALSESPVLFLSDSLKLARGKFSPFSQPELALLREVLEGTSTKYKVSASVKCPNVKEADMSPNNMKLCREHLMDTIDKVKPKLVFACGNLPMKMLIKKSGITNKRGSMFDYETEAGHKCIVVPIYHPYMVIAEPRHKYLFEVDIKNALDKVILGKASESKLEYKLVSTGEELLDMALTLETIEEPIACDIETTGLNFLRDKILTVAISSREKNWVVPVEHKEGNLDLNDVLAALRTVLQNPRNKKVFHNAKFDLKFLKRYNVEVVNPADTKVMHHFVDENLPKSLMDLVRLYFADEIAKF